MHWTLAPAPPKLATGSSRHKTALFRARPWNSSMDLLSICFIRDLCQFSKDWRSIQRSIDHVCKRRERYWPQPQNPCHWCNLSPSRNGRRSNQKSTNLTTPLQFHKGEQWPSSSRQRKKNPNKSEQSLVSNLRKKNFPDPNFFFAQQSATQQWILQKVNSLENLTSRHSPCPAAEETPQTMKSQQVSHCHSPVWENWFSRPKNHFFAPPLPRQKKQWVATLQFRKNDFPDPKIIFFAAPPPLPKEAVDNAKEDIPPNPSNRHSPISQKWFSRPKNHAPPRPPPTPRSSGPRKRRNPSNRHSPISQKWFCRPKNHFFPGQSAKRKKGKPQQSRLQFQKNDFPDPSSHFLSSRLPSSSGYRKRRSPCVLLLVCWPLPIGQAIFSSVAGHQSCKLKVLGSIPSMFLDILLFLWVSLRVSLYVSCLCVCVSCPCV